MEQIGYILSDLRYLRIFPRRYSKRAREDWREVSWGEVMRRYGNTQKDILNSGIRWRVITYDDGRKELAYLRVLQGGLLTGAYPAIYRGIIIPRRIDYPTFSHIRNIRLAF